MSNQYAILFEVLFNFSIHKIPVTETERHGDIVAEKEQPTIENFSPRAAKRN